MKEDEENASIKRGLRIDLIIALCALVVSSFATAASLWQSRVVADQLSSQVWPYLSISNTYDETYMKLDVVNNGLGPAIVRSTEVLVDGKPYANPLMAAKIILGHPPHHLRMGASMSDISPGSVIRSGDSVQVVRLDSAWAAKRFALNASRVDLRLCYCSLLGKCWFVSANQTGGPQPVADCPSVGANQLHVSPIPG
jgi:hypothetical protein